MAVFAAGAALTCGAAQDATRQRDYVGRVRGETHIARVQRETSAPLSRAAMVCLNEGTKPPPASPGAPAFWNCLNAVWFLGGSTFGCLRAGFRVVRVRFGGGCAAQGRFD
jgi:hypothetical protein